MGHLLGKITGGIQGRPSEYKEFRDVLQNRKSENHRGQVLILDKMGNNEDVYVFMLSHLQIDQPLVALFRNL
jgi:hypothetical protein